MREGGSRLNRETIERWAALFFLSTMLAFGIYENFICRCIY